MARLRLPGLVAVLLLAVGCGDDVTIALDPTSKSLLPGESFTFTATVTGTDETGVTWSVKEGATGGSVTDGGAYTAPARSGQYHVIATSQADATKSATATVTVATSGVLLTGTAPASPSNDNNPLVRGSAESGAAVKLFAGDDCNGVPIGSGVAGVDGKFEIAVSVPADSTTTFRATVTSAGGVSSDCSASTLTYVEDSTSPSTAIVFGTSVPSPGRQRDLSVEGTSEPHAVIRVFLDGACESDSTGTGTADDSGAFAVPVLAPANSTSRFYVRPGDRAGNLGPCSATSALYTHDDVAPPAATFASTDPASPSNENSVLVIGDAEAGSTVALFDGFDCLLRIGEGSAEDFASAGVIATVQDDRTTRIHAVVTDAAGNASACSPTSIVYVEDSTVDAPALDVLTPASPSAQRTVTLVGTAEELSTVELFAAPGCANTAVATTAASVSGSFEFNVEATPNAITSWSARTIDIASNVSSCSAAVTFTHDDQPPAAPRVATVAPASPAADTTPVISGSAEAGARVRLYSTSGCTGDVSAEGNAVGGVFSLEVTVARDSTTRIYGTATDAANNVSACSTSFVTYVEQSSAVVTLTLEPAAITLAPGGSTVFVAQVSGTTNVGVEWSVQEAGGGVISQTGSYVAPATSGTYHVVATSLANRATTATAVVTVVEDAASIVVEPALATVFVGQEVVFTATPANFEGVVVWEVATPDGGHVSHDGRYFAPGVPGRFVVVARSEDGTVRGSATVEVKLPEITGTVMAPEGRTGRVFISVRETGPFARGEPVAGTSIDAPGAFTVRGLPRLGTYRVEARMTSNGTASSTSLMDPKASLEVDLSQGPVEDVTLTLVAQAEGERPPPAGIMVFVDGAFALATVGAARDNEEQPWTTTHRFYLSTTQPATAQNAFFTRDLPELDSLVVLPKLEEGTEYFASAVGIYAGEPGPSVTFGPFSAMAPAEGFSISGQVHVEGDLPAGAIFVVSVEEDSPRFARLLGTTSPLAYTLSGLSSGTRQLAVLADLNGDDLLQPDEMHSMEASSRWITIEDGDRTDEDLFVRFAPPTTRLNVSTYASYAPMGSGSPDYFNVTLRAESGTKPFVRASVVAGPLAGLPYDMAVWPYGGPEGFVFSPIGSSQRPVVGTTYSVEAVDFDGDLHLLSAAIERVLDLPTPTSPQSVESDPTPVFAWTLPQTLPEGSKWSLHVYGEGDGAPLWSVWDVPASQRSLAWNSDGQAQVDSLERGRSYTWELDVRDTGDNGVRANYGFTIPVIVEVTPSTLTLEPGGRQTLLGEVVGSPGEQVIFSVEAGHGSIDALGNYTAPGTPGIYTVSAQAADHEDVFTTVTVSVVATPQVVVTPEPQQVSVGTGSDVQLNAVISGTTDHRVTWRLARGEGAVDETGRFSAAWLPGTDVVVATSVADPSKFAVFFVTAANDLPTLQLSATHLRLAPGESAALEAMTDGLSVSWRLLDGSGPTVTSEEVLAGEVPGVYRVLYSLDDDPSITAVATITVAHPDLAGSVSFAGSSTGRIVVQLYADMSDFPVAGTVIDGPGSFTLRGVSHRGQAHLVAWMDSSGSLVQKGSDPGVATDIEVTAASRSDLVLVLETPTPEVPGAPSLEVVAPFDSGAFLYFEPSTAAYGRPDADHHRVLASTSPTPDEGNSIVVQVPVGSRPAVFVAPLVNGDTYYFRVAADAPGGTSWSNVVGPVTIGAVPGGTTVSGTVEVASIPEGPLYVGLVGDHYRFVRIDAPTPTQAFTIPGVPAGAYELVALRDANANGTFEAGELQAGERFVVGDQPVTGLVLRKATASLQTSVTTRVQFNGGSAAYWLTFRVVEGSKPIQAVSIIGGREFPLPVDLGFRNEGGESAFVREVFRQNRAPVEGETYRLLVTFGDGTSEERLVSVKKVWANAPTIVSPIGTGTSTPTFTWLAPEAQMSSPFTYFMGVSASDWGGLWWADRLPQTQTSIAWNADGRAALSELSSGGTYHWWVGFEDADGNMVQTSATFLVE